MPFATRLNLGVGIQKASAHAHANVAPGIQGNDIVKQNVSQKRDGHLVERADNGVRGRTRLLNAIETGKVQKETNKSRKGILGVVLGCLNVGAAEKSGDFAHDKGRRQQKGHAQDIVDVDHAKLGEFDVLRGVFHVKHVPRGAHAVGRHPKQTRGGDGNVIPGRRDGAKEHDAKGRQHERFGLISKKEKVAGGGNDVGDVFEDRHHGHRIASQGGHAGEEHAAKEEVHGRPRLGDVQGERRILHPPHHFAEFDANHGDHRLKDHDENVEIAVDQVVVAESSRNNESTWSIVSKDETPSLLLPSSTVALLPFSEKLQ